MNKHLSVIPLGLLYFFAFGCQDMAVVGELEGLGEVEGLPGFVLLLLPPKAMKRSGFWFIVTWRVRMRPGPRPGVASSSLWRSFF
jgi:hypothetical protein